uniref:Outer capsid protein VP2 n=1 Tax=Palyam virus TaxID=40059 RepID=A0A4P9JFI0_9REOV|nr:VP2 [Palyam virus]
MDEFSIASIQEIPEERGAHIVQHEVASSDDDKVTCKPGVQKSDGKLSIRRGEILWDETNTDKRDGLFQRQANVKFKDAWEQLEGDEEKHTYPLYADIFNIIMRSRLNKTEEKQLSMKENKIWYNRIPTSLQTNESLYTQIRTTRDHRCGKVCVEPYFGLVSMDPCFADLTMHLRSPKHGRDCAALNGEVLYQAMLRHHFVIDIPNQKGLGQGYTLENDERKRTVITETGITSRKFQEINELRVDHPLRRIHGELLGDFQPDVVIRSMQDYALKEYGDYEGRIDEVELCDKVGWRVREIQIRDKRAESRYKRKENIFVQEWTPKLQSIRADMALEAKFASYTGILDALYRRMLRVGLDIRTDQAQWMNFIRDKPRVQDKNVTEWLRWMYRVEYVGSVKTQNDSKIGRSVLDKVANDDEPPWTQHILMIVISLVNEENSCLETGRRKWYSTVLRACLDLDPKVLARYKKYTQEDLTCGVEVSNPTADLGAIANRVSNVVSYVRMKWETDEIRFDAPIRSINEDVILKNEDIFLRDGFSRVDKETDNYFNDIPVHSFVKYNDYGREERKLIVTWYEDDEWRKPERFYSYYYRLVREESKPNTALLAQRIYEVEGDKLPYPMCEIAPHSREYLQTSLMQGALRVRSSTPVVEWKWMEVALRKYGAIERVGETFDLGCFTSQWSKCYLNEHINSHGPHPFFSKIWNQTALNDMEYRIINFLPSSITDSISKAISQIEGFHEITEAQIFYLSHAKHKVDALCDIIPFMRSHIASRTRGSMYALNIIPVILTCSPFASIKDRVFPILIHTSSGVRLIPVRTCNIKRAQNMSDWLMYFEGFMSKECYETITTEREDDIKEAFIKYYNHFETLSVYESLKKAYKLEMIESWVGVNCLGYCDHFVQLVPIRSPKKGFVFLIFGLGDSLHYVYARIRRMFVDVWTSCRGVYLIDTEKKESTQLETNCSKLIKYAKVEGDQLAVIWLLSSNNATFGNRHMMAKLMNNIM